MADMEASTPITYEWSGSGMTFSGESFSIPSSFNGGEVTATCTATQKSGDRTFTKSVEVTFSVGNSKHFIIVNFLNPEF